MVEAPPNASTSQKDQLAKTASSKDDFDSRNVIAATSELCFIFLPFLIIAIAFAHLGRFWSIFYLPEWSIVSAVITGQSLIKVASVSMKTRPEREKIILFMSMIIVLILVPVIIILAIALTSDPVTKGIAITQIVYFFIAALLFWLTTWLEKWSES